MHRNKIKDECLICCLFRRRAERQILTALIKDLTVSEAETLLSLSTQCNMSSIRSFPPVPDHSHLRYIQSALQLAFNPPKQDHAPETLSYLPKDNEFFIVMMVGQRWRVWKSLLISFSSCP